MALKQYEIDRLNELLLLEHPFASLLADSPDYSVPMSEYERDFISEDEYWEWNFFYILLVLESDGA